MEYVISVTDYELDDNGIVLDRDGGDLVFNDSGDFLMMFNYFMHSGPEKDIIDNGKVFIVQPKNVVGKYVTDYQITGESYNLWKECQAKEKERYNAMMNNNEGLPF